MDKTYYLKSNISLYLATLEEFSKMPFQFASLNEIIKQGNFNKGSFYYRFDDKYDLYLALISDLIIKQYDYIEKLKSVTLDLKSLKSYISILFESQFELYQENSKFIQLLELFSNESSDLKSRVYSIVGKSIIEIFCEIFPNYLYELQLSKDTINIFVNQVKSTYFNLTNILGQNISKESITVLVDNIVNGIAINNSLANSDVILSTFNLNHLYSKTNSGINNFSISINKNEILSIVGPSKSGKTTIVDIFEGNIVLPDNSAIKLNIGTDGVDFLEYNKSRFILNNNKSLYWNIKTVPQVSSESLTSNFIFQYFNIQNVFNKKIKRLSVKHQKIIELLIKSIAHKNLIIIDDLFRYFDAEESTIITNYLLKCRHDGSTIILTSSHIDNIISFSDKIAFLSEGRLINIKTVDELHQKYGKITHIIEYIDGNNTKIAAFSNDNFNSEFFKLIIDKYKILSMKTKTILPDEIFKLETGVNL